MESVVQVPKPSDLSNFIDFLYEGLEGYMYVVAKNPDDSESWDQVFFEYPAQKNVAVRAITQYKDSQEIYIAPALFKSKNAHKENVKASNVLWCDFDGDTPKQFDIPPSLIVRTSEPGHEHVYWKLDEALSDLDTIEDLNRRLCYKYGADNSGWDANQVLRPPYTINHKRNGLPVGIILQEDSLAVNLGVFDDLAPAPEKTVDYSMWERMDLPSLQDVIYRNEFGPDFQLVFEKQKAEVNDRSATLTNMAYICAETGLNDKEIYVIISHLAERWEKFKHHTPSSRARQLIGIIEHARIKYPHSNFNDFDEVFEYSPKTLLETTIEIDWAIPGMLMKNGVMLFGGPSGIGKTQMAMQYMAHLAMGKSFLHYEITKPHKLIFFSLEMGDMEVKHFLQSMYPVWQQMYGTEAIDNLNRNLTILPFGEALPLNTSQGQAVVIQYIERDHPDGVFIDSVGSAIFGSISDAANVQNFTNFNDKVRKRYGCFLWYIHHFRKPAPGTKSYGGQEDMFGDQYLVARATSVYTMTRAKHDKLRIRNPKNRHAQEELDYLVSREEGLFFKDHGPEDFNDPSAPSYVSSDPVVLSYKETKYDTDGSPTPY